MTTPSLTALLAALVPMVVACDLEQIGDEGDERDREEEVGTIESAVVSYPGGATSGRITTNRITTNRITTNRITTNRITTNRITTNRLTTNGAINTEFEYEMSDAGTREFFSYVISCALDSGQSVTFKSSSGANYTFEGALGFAPEWLSGPCGASCKEKVSGCVLARVNWTGRAKALSLRVIGDEVSATEAADHPHNEGAYYGDLFDQGTGPLPLNYCHYKPIARHCDSALDPSCPIAFRGGCDCTQVSGSTSTVSGSSGSCAPYNPFHDKPQQACLGGVQANGTFAFCSDGDWLESNGPGDPVRTRNFVYAIAVHSFINQNDGSDECAHPDYTTGTRLTPAACSVCARTVSRLGGKSHRTGANIAADAYCTNTAWDSLCVNKARDLCGDHSVCQTGDKMHRGDSRCVDDICAVDPYCCNNKWDSVCKNRVAATCGLDCSGY
jgi:hypothetical protein